MKVQVGVSADELGLRIGAKRPLRNYVKARVLRFRLWLDNYLWKRYAHFGFKFVEKAFLCLREEDRFRLFPMFLRYLASAYAAPNTDAEEKALETIINLLLNLQPSHVNHMFYYPHTDLWGILRRDSKQRFHRMVLERASILASTNQSPSYFFVSLSQFMDGLSDAVPDYYQRP
jgi:hypothetical protein